MVFVLIFLLMEKQIFELIETRAILAAGAPFGNAILMQFSCCLSCNSLNARLVCLFCDQQGLTRDADRLLRLR